MKKTYIAPEAEMLMLNVEMPLAMSDNVGNGYGGVDDGTHDPDVKEETVWDW